MALEVLSIFGIDFSTPQEENLFLMDVYLVNLAKDEA